MLDRRRLLGISPAAALGVTSVALPSAAAAASPGGDLANLDPPRSLTVDDTLAPDPGDDVAFRVRATTAAGALYDDTLQVTLAVTVDDGADGGAGSPASGTRIDGTERTQHTVTTTTGTVDLSVDLPGAGTYLIRVSASPAAVNQPDGVTVALTVA